AGSPKLAASGGLLCRAPGLAPEALAELGQEGVERRCGSEVVAAATVGEPLEVREGGEGAVQAVRPRQRRGGDPRAPFAQRAVWSRVPSGLQLAAEQPLEQLVFEPLPRSVAHSGRSQPPGVAVEVEAPLADVVTQPLHELRSTAPRPSPAEMVRAS